jgi:Zn-dependent peptidase ImmA (M78 family)
MSAATKRARARAEQRLTWFENIGSYLSEYVVFPQADYPVLDIPDDPLLLSDDEIEDAADQARAFWDLREGPVANMVGVLEHHGCLVMRDRLGADTLDSLSEWAPDENRPYLAIGTDKGTAVRWRFDAAHELGHILLHSNVTPHQHARQHKKIENQAHRFAAAFLLPMAAFGDDLFAISLDAFEAIKPKWKVSIATMIMRARHGGFLSEESEKRLWINLSRRGWRRHEPYDDELEPEHPRLYRQAFDAILAETGQTADDFETALNLKLRDIEPLSGLPAGYLANESAPVAVLRPRNPNVELETAAGADVLAFKPRPSD